MGRRRIDRRIPCHVIYCIDYRGAHDDQLTFMFKGCRLEHVRRVFDSLVIGSPYSMAHGYRLDFRMEEHIGVRKRSILLHRCSHRIMVRPFNPNLRMYSLDDMCLLIEARMRAEWPCDIERVTVNAFINA